MARAYARAMHARAPRRARLPLGQALLQELLAPLTAAAARVLGALEELRELLVAVALGVLLVLREPERVAQRLLREPDQVVVLVLGPGDIARLVGHVALPPSLAGRRYPVP